jgi:GxxExxY protein
MTKKYINDLAFDIIGAAINVHKELGPGLLESIYETCLCEELKQQSISYQRQISVAINYKGKNLNSDLRLDLLVEDLIICELKAVEIILPVHQAQVLSYMKLLQKPKGLLINFHTDNISKSYKPFVNEYFAVLPE